MTTALMTCSPAAAVPQVVLLLATRYWPATAGQRVLEG
jgi:hypothetical protein